MYEQLQAAVTKVPQHDMLLVMGYMNARFGSDTTDRERAMGSQGCETINNNGERLVNLCLNNNCAIGGIIFQHKCRGLKNQFQLLSTEEPDHPQVEGKWNHNKEIYTAKNTLGYLGSTDKTWLSSDTRRRIEERKTIK